MTDQPERPDEPSPLVGANHLLMKMGNSRPTLEQVNRESARRSGRGRKDWWKKYLPDKPEPRQD